MCTRVYAVRARRCISTTILLAPVSCSSLDVTALLTPTTVVVVVVVVVVAVVLTITRIIKSVVTGQAPVTPEWRNTPGKKHKQTKSGVSSPKQAAVADTAVIVALFRDCFPL